MAKARQKNFRVEMPLILYLQDHPDEIGLSRLKDHIRDAVRTWGGSLHPEDLLFDTVAKVSLGKTEVEKL